MKYLFTTLISLYISLIQASVTTDTAAPDFSLVDSFDKTISLSDFSGSTVVLEWTNHDCPFVAKHYKTGNMQSTQEYAKESGAVHPPGCGTGNTPGLIGWIYERM